MHDDSLTVNGHTACPHCGHPIDWPAHPFPPGTVTTRSWRCAACHHRWHEIRDSILTERFWTPVPVRTAAPSA